MQTRNSGPTMAYITDTFVQEPAWIQTARARGNALREGMAMSPYEGHLLRWLATLAGATNILEIGTFMGGTAMWMAASGARVTSLEFSAEYAALARQHVAASPHAHNIRIEQGDALTWLSAQQKTPTYDLVFIDADKPNYLNYLEAVQPLLRPRALIVGDNTLLWGAITGEDPDAAKPATVAAVKQFNATLADPAKYEGIMLPTIEGLTVARLK